ncbi:MAG TPA: hypothetical protein VHZ03_04625 [Trebonia sp.]|jgi:hypothetical protein|nr:hypothetical protein [Trebonia sp.]
MRRVPGRLAQGPALAVAVAAVIVLAAGVLAVVTWTSGSAAGRPSAQPGATTAGTPSAGPFFAGTAQPGAGSPGSPSATASGPGQQSQAQQGGQLTAGAGYVASVPMSALPSGGAARSGRIVALVIVSGVPSVSVRVAAMPGTLVRAATGGGYGARPVLDDLPGASQDQAAGVPGAAVVLSLAPATATGGASQAGDGQPGAALSVTLSPDVAWQLDFGGGAGPVAVDMTGGQAAGLDFAQGVSDVSVTLPRPAGTVLLQLEGGASQLAVSVPAGVAARVTAGDGASQVTVAGASYSGIAAGTVITQPGWASATGRVDIDATSGVSQVQVTEG